MYAGLPRIFLKQWSLGAGNEQRDKRTLVLLHPNMSYAAFLAPLAMRLSQHYRVVMFDQMNLGLNTRSPESHREAIGTDQEKGEAWIQDFAEQTFAAIDIPQKFIMASISWGALRPA